MTLPGLHRNKDDKNLDPKQEATSKKARAAMATATAMTGNAPFRQQAPKGFDPWLQLVGQTRQLRLSYRVGDEKITAEGGEM